MKLRKVSLTGFAIAFSFLAGVYQIIETCRTFMKKPIGTEISSIPNMTDYLSKLKFLYCFSDWINITALEQMGLNMRHAFFIAHWVEILTGMFSDPDVYQYNPDVKDYVFKLNSKRTLFYLQEMAKTNATNQKAAEEWMKLFGGPKATGVEDSYVWSFQEPDYASSNILVRFFLYDLLGDVDTVTQLQNDILRALKVHSNNIRSFLFNITARGALTPTSEANQLDGLEYRYGMACRKFNIRQYEKKIGLKFRRKIHTDYIKLPLGFSSPLLIEKKSILQSGVHVSLYLGGLPPMTGEDDNEQYRTETLFTCFTGGSVAVVEEHGRKQALMPDAKGVQCISYCVDPGPFYQKALRDVFEAHNDKQSQDVTFENVSFSACKGFEGVVKQWNQQDRIEQLRLLHKRRDSSLISFHWPIFHFWGKRNMGKKRSFGHLTQQHVLSIKLENTIRLSKSKSCVKTAKTDQLPDYYSKVRCEFLCKDKAIFQTRINCTIASVLYDTGGSFSTCTPGKVFKAIRNFKSVNGEEYKNLQLCLTRCEKLVPCESIRVKIRTLDPIVDTDAPSTENGVHYIRILPEQITFIREFEILPWQTFLANVGGLLGMFCGFSLIGAILWVFKFSGRIQKAKVAKTGKNRSNKTGLETVRAGVRLLFYADEAMENSQASRNQEAALD